MQETSRRMILNFEYLVKTIGFIPNGGRVYYLRRSQPPLFIPMVYEYYMATEDDEFLHSMMTAMEMVFRIFILYEEQQCIDYINSILEMNTKFQDLKNKN